MALRRLAEPLQPDPALPELILTAEWLGELREYDALLGLIPETKALTHPDLARLRLGALAGKKDWAAMDRFLARPERPLPPPVEAIFQAGIVQLAGRTEEAAARWQLALAAAGPEPALLELLARQAESAGAPGPALEAWQRMLAEPRLVPRAAGQMLRLGSATRDLPAMVTALHRLVPLRSDQPDLRLSLAFCQLMLGLDREAAQTALAAGAQTYPDQGLFHVTSALAAFRDGQTDRALGELEHPAVQWTDAPIAWTVVRVAILGRAGDRRRAREIAAKLTPAKLAAAELALVNEWLPETSAR